MKVSAFLPLLLFLGASARSAQAGLTLGLINGGSDFFGPVEEGFLNKCNQFGHTCYSRTSDDVNGTDDMSCQEVRLIIMRELIALGVDGVAAKLCGLPPLYNTDLHYHLTMLEEMEEAGVPFVTFDSDIPESPRVAYIGTDEVFLGRTLAKLVRQLRPEGGTFALIGNKDLREEGFVEEITRYNNRSGWGHWNLVENDIPHLSTPGIVWNDYLQSWADLNPSAMITLVQSPMNPKNNWTDFIDANRHRNITYIGTDGADYQLAYLSSRYVDGLVGQLPYEFGSVSVDVLTEYIQTGSVPKDFYATNIVAYNLIPLELPPADVDENLIGNLKYMGFICFGVVALTALACMGWTYYYSSNAVVRAAQPFFLAMVAIGVLIMSSSLVPLSFDDGGGEPPTVSETHAVAICMSVPWLGFIGFTVTFSALLAKTWRVNRLFNNKVEHARIQISEKDVLGPFAILLIGNIVVLICWTVLDPLTYIREENTGTDYWNRVISSDGVCRSENSVAYLVPLAVLNFSVVVFASWQAHRARELESVFSESRYIALTVFSLFQAFCTGIPVVVVVKDQPEAFYLVMTIMIFVLCMAILLLIFLPKVFMQKSYAGMTEDERNRAMNQMVKRSSLRRRTSGKGLTASSNNDFSGDFSSKSIREHAVTFKDDVVREPELETKERAQFPDREGSEDDDYDEKKDTNKLYSLSDDDDEKDGTYNPDHLSSTEDATEADEMDEKAAEKAVEKAYEKAYEI